jgi:hypothetical protein
MTVKRIVAPGIISSKGMVAIFSVRFAREEKIEPERLQHRFSKYFFFAVARARCGDHSRETKKDLNRADANRIKQKSRPR